MVWLLDSFKPEAEVHDTRADNNTRADKGWTIRYLGNGEGKFSLQEFF